MSKRGVWEENRKGKHVKKASQKHRPPGSNSETKPPMPIPVHAPPTKKVISHFVSQNQNRPTVLHHTKEIMPGCIAQKMRPKKKNMKKSFVLSLWERSAWSSSRDEMTKWHKYAAKYPETFPRKVRHEKVTKIQMYIKGKRMWYFRNERV